MIFGKWHPSLAAAACLLFGAAEALQITLRGSGSDIPTQLLQMLPYVLIIVTLVGLCTVGSLSGEICYPDRVAQSAGPDRR